MKSPSFSRRQFITATGMAVAFPTILSSRVLGRDATDAAPSQKIVAGVVGCGNEGTIDMRAFLTQKDCQVVAVCDVDKKHLAEAATIVNNRYQNKDCKTYHDFRELMARPDIDIIIAAVPDHWHELVSVEAARRKKDIYGEKPLAHTVAEQQAMVKAVQENGRIWQMGSWQRSEANFRKAAEIVRNGMIGDVTEVQIGLLGAPHNSGEAAKSMEVSEPPPELDYETWIGPSKMMPYIQGRVHRNWRWNYNTGGGQLMDWIGHHCDIAHWGCDFDNSGPSEIEGHGEFPAKDAVWNAVLKYRIELKYPRNIKMTIAGGYPEIRSGVKWIGTNGWVWVNRNGFESSNEEWSNWHDVPEKLLKVKLYVSNNHQRNFLDCVKSRKPTVTPIEVGHHSAIPGHLGLISMLTNRKIRWDVATEKIQDDPEASQMLTRPFRAPWVMG